jgi:uncharacterized membrane protein
MELYAKKIKRRKQLLILAALIAVGSGIFDVFYADSWLSGNVAFNFQCGLFAAGGILALIKVFWYRKVLEDENLLKLEYNKENDERRRAIREKAGMPMILIMSVIILMAGIIAGYFNETVFLALIATALCQLVIGMAVKVYYMRKM